mmetsp:Transcript_3106/g.7466  ORF Transcript_3106/g.7466 Transcript_3106/m.7466 type:complete len:294 (-) Transcript_3106:120-1001(-)
MVDTTVRPCFARTLRATITFCAWNESRPLVGSSRKMSDGSDTSSVPMFTRLRSPPDTPRTKSFPTLVCCTSRSPSSEMMLVTRSSFCCCDMDRGNRSVAEKAMVSRTVSSGKKRSSCSTIAVYEEYCLKFRGDPLTRISPPNLTLPVSISDAPSRLRSVVLPAPDDPMIASTSPLGAHPEMSDSTCTVSLFFSLVTSRETLSNCSDTPTRDLDEPPNAVAIPTELRFVCRASNVRAASIGSKPMCIMGSASMSMPIASVSISPIPVSFNTSMPPSPAPTDGAGPPLILLSTTS